jgi:hypothetical protein
MLVPFKPNFLIAGNTFITMAPCSLEVESTYVSYFMGYPYEAKIIEIKEKRDIGLNLVICQVTKVEFNGTDVLKREVTK